MTNLNPMFSETLLTPAPSKAKKESNRKKREDALKDIKIPVSLIEKLDLKMFGYKIFNESNITRFATSLIKEGLDIEYIDYVPEVDRPSPKDTVFVHAKLRKEEHTEIVNISAKWNCSIRLAARRIIINLLKEKKGVC
ncbi:hypothetical protein ACFFIX_19710 [Metabacillus herbersteinensis]|uniref:Uncharacterized protein n=1 Tax=Metabacillus herbersteinensis TaxID=283816 RepID=A0ABV6GIU6_9BACI